MMVLLIQPKPERTKGSIAPRRLAANVYNSGRREERRHQAVRLDEAYLFSLQTFRSFGDNERHPGPLIERAIAARFNCREMDEDIFAVLSSNKSKSFSGVKPLHRSRLFHKFLFSSVGNPGRFD